MREGDETGPGRQTLDEQQRAFEVRRNALLDELEESDPIHLRARPRPGAWSILEVVEHLVVAERAVLRGLPDPARLEDRPRTLRNRLGYRFVTFVLRAGIPVRVPSETMLPTGDRTLDELRRMWDENQEWLARYIATLDGAGSRRAVFHHPVTGPLRVEHALRLGRIHFDRHLGQIRRLQESD